MDNKRTNEGIDDSTKKYNKSNDNVTTGSNNEKRKEKNIIQKNKR